MVELQCLPCSTMRGGASARPAEATWVEPNGVGRSVVASSNGASSSVSSYASRYRRRPSSETNPITRPTRPTAADGTAAPVAADPLVGSAVVGGEHVGTEVVHGIAPDRVGVVDAPLRVVVL